MLKTYGALEALLPYWHHPQLFERLKETYNFLIRKQAVYIRLGKPISLMTLEIGFIAEVWQCFIRTFTGINITNEFLELYNATKPLADNLEAALNLEVPGKVY